MKGYDAWKTRSDRDDWAAKNQPEDVFVDDAGLDVPLKSVAIRRLIEEVRVDGQPNAQAYNRIYNRHNR